MVPCEGELEKGHTWCTKLLEQGLKSMQGSPNTGTQFEPEGQLLAWVGPGGGS